MKCKQCHIEKEVNKDNFYRTNSKFGFDKTCKMCRLDNKINKPRDNKKSIYQKSKYGYINPTNPIPVKLTTEDGYGGNWKFDIDNLQKNNEFARLNGQLNRMSKSRISCWQVKVDDFDEIVTFCDTISMSRKSIIQFPKSDKTIYVVNLYHKDILQVVK